MMNNASYLADSDTIKVEHIFTLSIDEKWDKSIRRAVDSMLEISWQWAQSSQIICYGIAAYFVMLGASKLIGSVQSKSVPPPLPVTKPAKESRDRSSKKSSRSSSGSSGSATKTTKETTKEKGESSSDEV